MPWYRSTRSSNRPAFTRMVQSPRSTDTDLKREAIRRMNNEPLHSRAAQQSLEPGATGHDQWANECRRAEGSVPDLYGARDWTKGREFSSLRVPRRHSWARTPGISSVIMSVSQNSI